MTGRAQQVTLTVTRLPGGGLRFTSDQPGWAAEARGVFEIANAIGEAFVEADIAAYARARGTIRDVTVYDDHVDAVPPRSSVNSPDPDLDATPRPELLHRVEAAETRAAFVHARPVRTVGQQELHRARLWARRPDGKWRSPGGRVYRADSEHVRRIIAILTEHGEEPRVIPAGDGACRLATVHSLDEARTRRVRRQPVEELI